MTPMALMESIAALMVSDFNDPARRDELIDYVADEITTPASASDDLFRLLAAARGCHEIAGNLYASGDADKGRLYAAFGQDLLAKAVATLAAYTLADARLHAVTFQ